jgi:adenine-specific DNA-methyltransferase
VDNRILVGDCRELLKDIADSSVDAIVTDPPYFKVKREEWDNQWDKPTNFLQWLGGIADEWKRVLKPNGSLFCFASPRMTARVEVMLSERFNVLNCIRWDKSRLAGGGIYSRTCKEALRSFFPAYESIIFCEQEGADNSAKGEAGYAAQCDSLRGFVFEPLRNYLADEFRLLGWTAGRLNQICGTASMAGRHYTARSQWCLPTPEHYGRLQAAAEGRHLRREYEDLRREYEDLRREYEDLRREYEDLRRPFFVSKDVPYTDTWTFPTVGRYPGKHPCEKPQQLLRHVIRSATKPGALVLDTFAGTGSTGLACIAEGRAFLGLELSPVYAETARARINAAKTEPQLDLFGHELGS